MRRHRFVQLAAAALVATLLGACRDSAGPGGGGERTAALDDVIVQAGLPGGFLYQDGAPSHLPCTYSAPSGRFECPPMTFAGVTIRRSFAFLDASGASQRAFDPLTTAAINMRSSIDGTRSDPVARITSEMHHASDMTVSGLAGNETEHILNGTGGGTTTTTFEGERGPMRTVVELADTTSALVVPVPDRRVAPLARASFPRSGTIVRVSRTTGTDTQGHVRTFLHRVKTTFDGTSTARIEITTDAGTRTCAQSLEPPFTYRCE